jgi:hypothetical protein
MDAKSERLDDFKLGSRRTRAPTKQFLVSQQVDESPERSYYGGGGRTFTNSFWVLLLLATAAVAGVALGLSIWMVVRPDDDAGTCEGSCFNGTNGTNGFNGTNGINGTNGLDSGNTTRAYSNVNSTVDFTVNLLFSPVMVNVIPKIGTYYFVFEGVVSSVGGGAFTLRIASPSGTAVDSSTRTFGGAPPGTFVTSSAVYATSSVNQTVVVEWTGNLWRLNTRSFRAIAVNLEALS